MKRASVVCPEGKEHLFQEHRSASSDLSYPILLWGRHLAEVPHAWPAFTGQIQLCSPTLRSQSSFLSLQGAGILLPSMTLLPKEALCDLSYSKVLSDAVLPLSRPSVQPLLEKLFTVLSKLCLAILPFGQTCCPSLACTSIPTGSGNHPMHLPQLYKAAAAFIVMARVLCLA